jgi:broad specificity phosphatase PhoE
MAQLILVRHAQASFFGADYDELSAEGVKQAEALGRHWARHGVAFEATFIGPRRRHRQTCEQVALAYREAGLAFPEPRELDELDEHHGPAIIKAALGQDPATAALSAEHSLNATAAEREQAVREFFRHYDTIMREWADGAHALPGVESWAEFRARTLKALDVLCAGPGGARVAFTSGGFVSSAVGWLLGLEEGRVIDISLVLANTALTEVGWSQKRRRLVSFNALPHLPDPGRVTRV